MYFGRGRSFRLEALEIRRLLSAYYVSNVGNDRTGNGSLANPYATIQLAASLAQPGDVVNVEPGAYGGFVLGWDTSGLYGPINGTAAAPITIQADPAATVGSVYITSRDNKTPDGIDLETGNSFVNIEGFTIINIGTITDYGIKVADSNDIHILNNHATLAGKTGIFTAFSNDVLIEGNASSDNREHGIYVSNSPIGARIVDNFAYGNANGGIQINADASEGGSGVAEYCLIYGNEIFDNGLSGGGALNFDGVQSSVIENNLLFDNHSSGIVLFQEDGATGSMNNIVANNTVVMAADSRWALEIDTNSTGNQIFNNIFFNANPEHGDISVDASSAPGTVSDDNVLTGVEDLYGVNVDLAAWQNQTGQDLNSVQSTPAVVFANSAIGNFHLMEGSPALGIGTANFHGDIAVNTDFQGRYWTVGPVDAGVYHLPARTVPDASNPALLDLIVIGTTGNDTMAFNLEPNGMVDVEVDGQSRIQVPVSKLALIKAFGGLGNNSIGVDPAIKVKARLNAGTGNTIMAASSGYDTLIGQGGDDTLIGNGGFDLLIGGEGNNSIQAGGGNDSLVGGPGNDILIGAGGDNLMYGQGGDDSIYTAVGSFDTIYGGSGQDTLHALGQVVVPDNDIPVILQS